MTYTCPGCSSKACKRNGYTRHGKQNHRCLDCGRQFSLEPAIAQANELKFETVSAFLSESLSIWSMQSNL